MRKYYWYLTAYFRKHGVVVILSLLVAIGFFSFVIPSLVKSLEQKPRRYVGLVGQYTLDSLPATVSAQISSGLTTLNNEGSVEAGIAERWLVEDEGRSYRFVVRDDLTWQDGKELTPEDVKYNFKDVEVITTPNDIVFKLPDAYVPFPTVVATPVIRFAEEKYLFFWRRRMPIGLGQYRVVDYKQRDNQLTELVVDHPKERFIYRFYLTEDQALTAFKHGQVDELPEMSQKTDVAGWPNITVTEITHADRYLGIFLNTQKPQFDKNMRQAFAYALQKPTDDTRAIGPINPQSWAYLDGGKRYEYDLQRAIERSLDPLPSAPLTFTLTTPAAYQQLAESIKAQWESFGVEAEAACQKNKDIENKAQCQNLLVAVQIRVSNFPDTLDYDALLIGQQIPADPDQYFLWHSAQTTNFTHYKNTRIDALLEKGRTTANFADRKAIYQEFQQFFLEDSPVIFLYHLPTYSITRG
jgi:peptide/nickel transport system substrate-binding protein